MQQVNPPLVICTNLR